MGTAAGPGVEDERVERLLSWADELSLRRHWPVRCALLTARRRTQRVAHAEAAASYAFRAIPKLCDETHTAVLALVDELIAVGTKAPASVELPRGSRERIAL